MTTESHGHFKPHATPSGIVLYFKPIFLSLATWDAAANLASHRNARLGGLINQLIWDEAKRSFPLSTITESKL